MMKRLFEAIPSSEECMERSLAGLLVCFMLHEALTSLFSIPCGANLCVETARVTKHISRFYNSYHKYILYFSLFPLPPVQS